jgi:cytochrome c-type biogenesis protein CcmH
MLLAAACALLTLVVIGIVMLPLLRRRVPAGDEGRYDRAVYRDQLAELDADVARGLVSEDAAVAARLEIERRMLATARPAPEPVASRRGTPIVAAALVVALMLLPAAIYLRYGAPQLPDEPFAARVISTPSQTAAAPGEHDLTASLAGLEEKLQKEPDNAERWMLYARTLSALGRYDDALQAYSHVVRLVPDDPEVLEGYGEMQVMAAQGIVTPAARETFVKTLAKDPEDQVARFYLALADEQAGEPRKAIDAWMKLAPDATAGSDMYEEIARRVTEAAATAGIPAPTLPAGRPFVPPAAEAAASPAVPAPDAAASMTPEQRDAMIRSMVAQLAARLEKAPNDADGWLRLGRAYAVLNDAAKSADAYAHAAKLRPDDASIPLQQAAASIDAMPQNQKVPPDLVAQLDHAKAAMPNAPEVFWYLGVAAVRNGNRIEAAADWTHLLDLLPANSDDRKMVQDALDALK